MFDFGKDGIHFAQVAALGVLKHHLIEHKIAFQIEIEDVVGRALCFHIQINEAASQIHGIMLLQIRLDDI